MFVMRSSMLLVATGISLGFQTGCVDRRPEPNRGALERLRGFESVGVIAQDRTNRLDEGSLAQLEGDFAGDLATKGYRVAERAKLKHVLDELKLDRSGITKADYPKIGEAWNAKVLLIVEVLKCRVEKRTKFERWIPIPVATGEMTPDYEAEALVQLRAVDVEQAEVIGTSKAAGNGYVYDRADSDGALEMATEAALELIPARSRLSSGSSTNPVQKD